MMRSNNQPVNLEITNLSHFKKICIIALCCLPLFTGNPLFFKSSAYAEISQPGNTEAEDSEAAPFIPTPGDLFLTAVTSGHLEAVKQHLATGLDTHILDEEGSNALMIAASKGHIEIVQFFVQQGFDVNAQNHWGKTALMLAAEHNHPEILTLLLEHNADIHAIDFSLEQLEIADNTPEAILDEARSAFDSRFHYFIGGNNALLWAVQGKSLECVKRLLAAGLSVESQDADDRTALMLASETGQPHLVAYLLSQHADASYIAPIGSALEMAYYNLEFEDNTDRQKDFRQIINQLLVHTPVEVQIQAMSNAYQFEKVLETYPKLPVATQTTPTFLKIKHQALQEIGLNYLKKNQAEAAKPYLKQLLNLSYQLSKMEGNACILYLFDVTSIVSMDPRTALQLLEELEVSPEERPRLAFFKMLPYLKLATTAQAKKDYLTAEGYLKKGETLLKKVHPRSIYPERWLNRFAQSNALNYLQWGSELYFQNEDLRAIEKIEHGLTLFKAADDTVKPQASFLILLMNAHSRVGDQQATPTQKCFHYAKALDYGAQINFAKLMNPSFPHLNQSASKMQVQQSTLTKYLRQHCVSTPDIG